MFLEQRTILKRVPIGTNPYQAAWIPEGDVDSLEEHDQSMDEETPDNLRFQDSDMKLPKQIGKDEELEIETDDQPPDLAEEESEHLKFPDEVDTPEDIAARIR